DKKAILPEGSSCGRELFRMVFSSNVPGFQHLRSTVVNLWMSSSNSAPMSQVSCASVLFWYIQPRECALRLLISVNAELCRCVTRAVNLRSECELHRCR